MGLMNVMVTISHNDSCPEMLAAIRRGLFAKPTEEELIEFLLQRKPRDRKRPEFEEHSLEHVPSLVVQRTQSRTQRQKEHTLRLVSKVLSYQRRNVAFKHNFLKRDTQTPLGIAKDWFDRPDLRKKYTIGC